MAKRPLLIATPLLWRYVRLALMFMLISLLIGIVGYHYSDDMPWLDSLLNASMILGGMGPVDGLHTDAGKLFASFYALYSCFVVLGVISILMTPAMHRALHLYHSDPDNKADCGGDKKS